MQNADTHPAHHFHIPVMGTGFTIDTPLRVARYGIRSVVQLGDDTLMERLRRHYSQRDGHPFTPIGPKEEDARARRITAWLDYLHDRVQEQSASLRQSPFEPGSELWRYYELLPQGELKSDFEKVKAMPAGPSRDEAIAALREAALPGAIDVNVMTKLDRTVLMNGQALPPDGSDAMSAVRGYAKSKVNSTLVFSAGMNPRLYGYLTSFTCFRPDAAGRLLKKIAMKVSDFRSAAIQGKFLAKKGIWISEFRVESGLNCGGHAFAGSGKLLGPILQEFRNSWNSLREDLMAPWRKANSTEVPAPEAILSVQGGVGNQEEHELMRRLGAHSVGWGTPFLLVPEATALDDRHRQLLCEAGESDVELSDGSPLGIPFWRLKTSTSEDQRRKRIAEGKHGSPCPHQYLAMDPTYGNPLCGSSRKHQLLKLADIAASTLSPEAKAEAEHLVMEKACICPHLANGALIEAGVEKEAPVAICPGPNIAWFKRIATLEEMIGHIYGRFDLLGEQAKKRPHMLLTELRLALDFARRELHRSALGLAPKGEAYFKEFRENLEEGVKLYEERAEELFGRKKAQALERLRQLREEIEGAFASLTIPSASPALT